AGDQSNAQAIQAWPEVQTSGLNGVQVVARTTLLGELFESYKAGFQEGKVAKVRNGVAQKLKLPPNHFADNRGKDLLKLAHEAYEKGFADGEAHKPPQPPQLEATQLGRSEALDAYELGYNNGKDPTPYNLGFADGATGSKARRNQVAQMDAPEVGRL